MSIEIIDLSTNPPRYLEPTNCEADETSSSGEWKAVDPKCEISTKVFVDWITGYSTVTVSKVVDVKQQSIIPLNNVMFSVSQLPSSKAMFITNGLEFAFMIPQRLLDKRLGEYHIITTSNHSGFIAVVDGDDVETDEISEMVIQCAETIMDAIYNRA